MRLVLQVCNDVKERARATGFSLLGEDAQGIGSANSSSHSKNKSIVRQTQYLLSSSLRSASECSLWSVCSSFPPLFQVALKEEQAERARRLRRAAMEEEMLGDFVRLVDYMTVENLVLITLNTNQEFLETLQQPRKQGIFLTTLNFGSDAIEFAPTSEDVNQVFLVSSRTEWACALLPHIHSSLLIVGGFLLAPRSLARRSIA